MMTPERLTITLRGSPCGTTRLDERSFTIAERKWVWLIVVLLLASTGCSPSASRAQEAVGRLGSNESGYSHSEGLSSAGLREFNEILASGNLPELNRRKFGVHREELKELYSSSNYTLPWLLSGKPTAQAHAMVHLLETAENKGLDPEDYDASRWDARVTKLDRSPATSESELLRFDIALTLSTMRYISDLRMGRVNPHPIPFEIDTGQQKLSLSQFVRCEIIQTGDVAAAVAAVEPPFPAYRRTLAALETYLDLARRDDGEQLPGIRKTVKSGDPYSGLPRLQRLLTLLGDLPNSRQANTPTTAYQGDVVEAVKHFQQRHGLEPNGFLDTQTLKQLNTPLGRRVIQLQLTLERWRWAPHSFDRPPVVVNIPEFRLRAEDENYHAVLSMKVVVGKAYDHHQTPVFSSAMQAVILRPYWEVPPSITNAELLPKIEKDPAYLGENSFEIVDRNGGVRSSQKVDSETEEQLRAGLLRIRQRPGPDNSLGLVKFDFPNSYNVYMHGTPAMELFARSRRDFSHGCIRVEDPIALAAWALTDKPQWTVDRIKQAIAGEETIRIPISNPIPVLIVYGTAVVMEDGEIRFFDDIYKEDADLEQALVKRD